MKENLHVHEHKDHFHVHEHYHGGDGNIVISTIGLVLHSVADGVALGVTLFSKITKFNSFLEIFFIKVIFLTRCQDQISNINNLKCNTANFMQIFNI